MEKRAYLKPTILKVQLNPEQAVLAVCSTRTTTIRTNSNVGCRTPVTPSFCRKSSTLGSADSGASS